MTARPGTSVSSFFARFPDDEACLEHMFRSRFSEGACPRCETQGKWSRIRGTMKWLHSCRRHVSPREGTVVYRSNLSLMAWFYAFLLSANAPRGPSAAFIRRQLGLGTKSAHRLCLHVRFQFAALERPSRLGGEGKKVHVDEAHIPQIDGLEDAASRTFGVFACACDGVVLSCLIQDRRASTLKQAMRKFIHPDSIIVSDGHASYRSIVSGYRGHIAINHARAFTDFKGTTNNEVETYFGTLKRDFRAFQKVHSRNAWAYLAEVEQRYNRRRCSTSLFDTLIGHFPILDTEAIADLQRAFDLRPPVE